MSWIGQQFFAPHDLPLMIGSFGASCVLIYGAPLSPLALATAIAAMHLTRTLHPPGGATALIATLGSPDIQALGFFWYVLMPATLGPLLLLLVALVVNNLPKTRRYPEIWF